jgi:hypothetical protein
MDRAPEYNVTNLPNGFTVLTESQTFPGAVHMGKYYLASSAFYFVLILIILIRTLTL